MNKKLNDDNTVLLKVIEQQQQTIEKLHQQIEQLQHKLDRLLQLLYGTKSEKRKSTLKSEITLLPPKNKSQSNKTSKNKNGRRPLPKEFPRVRVVHDVPAKEQQCQCCSQEMSRLGEVITEQLECEPAKLYVIEHVRYKYSCQKCKQNIITANLPAQPIEKGLPGPGLLTEVTLNKYQYHCPLHRQEQRFANLGIEFTTVNIMRLDKENWRFTKTDC